VFEGFIARPGIFKNNLTLMGYEKDGWAGLSDVATEGRYPEDHIPECFLAASKCAIAVSSWLAAPASKKRGSNLPPRAFHH
jgi:hypothetical protein